MQVL
ncbi:unnamed protein product [Larinioides sclopetarius]|jgi:hypothetical protein